MELRQLAISLSVLTMVAGGFSGEQSRGYSPTAVALNGLRFDEHFTKIAPGDRILSEFAMTSRAVPFWLSLQRSKARVVWTVRATNARAVYTKDGRFAVPVIVATFDGFTGKRIAIKNNQPLPALPLQPNATMRPATGPVTPCPMAPVSTARPAHGYAYTTAPPNGIKGQNYHCLRPIHGVYPVRRPPANADMALRSLRPLAFFYEHVASFAARFPAYIVEIKLVPFGAAAKDLGGITTYGTQSRRLVIVTKVIAPHGMGARYCMPPMQATAIYLTDATTLTSAGGGARTYCKNMQRPQLPSSRAGPFLRSLPRASPSCPPPAPGPRPYLVLIAPENNSLVSRAIDRVVFSGWLVGLTRATLWMNTSAASDRPMGPIPLTEQTSVPSPPPASRAATFQEPMLAFRIPPLQPKTTYWFTYTYNDSMPNAPCWGEVEGSAGSFSTL